MTVFWMALFIIRPWERLIPELAAWHVERTWALAVIAVVVSAGALRLHGSFQTTAVLLFSAALTISSVFAADGAAAWDELYKYITLVIFYFILLSVIRTPYELFFVAACYVAIMGVYVGKSEYEYFFHGAARYTMGVSRLIGIETTYGGPNAVAASCVLSLPIAHFLWRIRKPFTETWPRIWQVWFPRCLVVYFALAASATVLTNSRSGMLGLVVFVGLVLVAMRKARGRMVAVVSGVLLLSVIWVAMPEENKNRLRTVWDPSRGPKNAQESADGRIEGMKAGIEMFRRVPVTGVGIGNFVKYRVAEVDGVALQSHSLIGQILGETGVLGTGAFLLLLAALFANCRKTKAFAKGRASETAEMLSHLAVACQLSVILLLYFGLFGHNMLRFSWLWLAAFALLAREFCATVRDDEDAVFD